jgi:large subunit ribosomal protein L32
MAPLPKRRHSTRRGGKRKAAIKLTLTAMAVCKQCGAAYRPHTVCANCGYYDGKPVVAKKPAASK